MLLLLFDKSSDCEWSGKVG